MKSDPKPQQQLIEEVKRKQRNTVWPDTMVNGRSVDEYLWKGSPEAPLVQRVGAWLFGGLFMVSGVSMIEAIREMSPDRKSPASVIVGVLIAVLFFGVGLKVFINGFQRRRRDHRKLDD